MLEKLWKTVNFSFKKCKCGRNVGKTSGKKSK